MKPRIPVSRWQAIPAGSLLAVMIVLWTAFSYVGAQAIDPISATPIPTSIAPTAPSPAPVTPTQTPALSLTPFEERTLAQQDRVWLVTIAALLTTAAVTVAGWIVTYQQQARLTDRQERAAVQLQEKILRVQEQLERERALSTTKLERLKSLADYLEFPNRMAGKRDPDELRQLYCDQWEVFYGFYFQLALRFDPDVGELPRQMRQMDEHIDRWARSLADGAEVAAAARADLIPAMRFSRHALDRLDAIETRLVMGKLDKVQEDAA